MPKTDSARSLTTYAAGLLSGQRIRLRTLHDDDLQCLARWWNDPEWMILQQARVLPIGENAAEQLFRSWSSNTSETGFGYSVVDEADTLIGHLALWGVTPTSRIGSIGLIIGPPYIDQGYGSDVVGVALRLAFDELALNKVELRVWSFNERALHVYTKLGFLEEGRRRAVVFHRGAFADEVIMGMLASEYEPRQQTFRKD